MALPRLEGKAGWREAGRGFKGTFQPGCAPVLADRKHRSLLIEGTGRRPTLQGTFGCDSRSCPLSCPGQGNKPCESAVQRGGGGEGSIKARSKGWREKRHPPSTPDHPIPLELGLSRAQAQSSSSIGSGERQGQLTADG